MKAFFTNHEGKFDSSLFFRFIWHVILIGAWIYYAFFDEPPRIDPLAHLGFAAGMALGEDGGRLQSYTRRDTVLATRAALSDRDRCWATASAPGSHAAWLARASCESPRPLNAVGTWFDACSQINTTEEDPSGFTTNVWFSNVSVFCNAIVPPCLINLLPERDSVNRIVKNKYQDGLG